MSEPTASDHLSQDYALLRQGPRTEQLERELAASGYDIGVVLDDSGSPESLLGPDGRGPLIQVGLDTPLSAIIHEEGLWHQITHVAPGVAVFDGVDIVGVIRRSSLIDFFFEQYESPEGKLRFPGSDLQLHGTYTQPRMTITCTTCGTMNELVGFVLGSTNCSLGHILTVNWGT